MIRPHNLKMAASNRIKPRGRYLSISVPIELYSEIADHIKKSSYNSIADFVKTSVRTQMKIDNKEIYVPGFQDDPLTQVLDGPEDSEKVLTLLAALVAEKLKKEK